MFVDWHTSLPKPLAKLRVKVPDSDRDTARIDDTTVYLDAELFLNQQNAPIFTNWYFGKTAGNLRGGRTGVIINLNILGLVKDYRCYIKLLGGTGVNGASFKVALSIKVLNILQS